MCENKLSKESLDNVFPLMILALAPSIDKSNEEDRSVSGWGSAPVFPAIGQGISYPTLVKTDVISSFEAPMSFWKSLFRANLLSLSFKITQYFHPFLFGRFSMC